jgi:hypothetical protein
MRLPFLLTSSRTLSGKGEGLPFMERRCDADHGSGGMTLLRAAE